MSLVKTSIFIILSVQFIGCSSTQYQPMQSSNNSKVSDSISNEQSKPIVRPMDIPTSTKIVKETNNKPLVSESEKLEWLESHNTYRKKHGSPPVVWSDEIALSAEKHLTTCPSGHSNSSQSASYGENMAFASYKRSPKDVVEDWYSEESNFDYDDIKYQSGAGHFTQVVWKDTSEIGCAYKQCATGGWSHIWVCQYNPAGNVLSRFSRNVSPIQ